MTHMDELVEAAKAMLRVYLKGKMVTATELERDLCGVGPGPALLHFSQPPWFNTPFFPALREMIVADEVSATLSADRGWFYELKKPS